MKNRYLLIAVLFSGLCTSGFGQDNVKKEKDWRAIAVAQHQKGKWLVGAGPTFLGATVKAGRFVANRTWVGVESELHGLLSDRREAGVFARYYTWNGGVFSGFTELGVSYGRFQGWGGFFGEGYPPTIYRTAKLNLAIGLEVPVSRRLGLEGVAKIGRLTQTDWYQPSFQGSINVYLGR